MDQYRTQTKGKKTKLQKLIVDGQNLTNDKDIADGTNN